VALANAQEALKQTRRMVWRNRGEPAVELETVEECFEHALRGGARKFAFLAFTCTRLLWAGLGSALLRTAC
jgi:hypothetical protein